MITDPLAFPAEKEASSKQLEQARELSRGKKTMKEEDSLYDESVGCDTLRADNNNTVKEGTSQRRCIIVALFL